MRLMKQNINNRISRRNKKIALVTIQRNSRTRTFPTAALYYCTFLTKNTGTATNIVYSSLACTCTTGRNRSETQTAVSLKSYTKKTNGLLSHSCCVAGVSLMFAFVVVVVVIVVLVVPITVVRQQHARRTSAGNVTDESTEDSPDTPLRSTVSFRATTLSHYVAEKLTEYR